MSDLISRKAAIDEIEYELEMINSSLDSITLDFNTREKLRQRRGEAREILNSIQQLPSAEPKRGRWISDGHHIRCDQCGMYMCDTDREGDRIPTEFCPHCGTRMEERKDDE